MAKTKTQQVIEDEKNSGVPTEDELFAHEAPHEISESDVFASPYNFNDPLIGTSRPTKKHPLAMRLRSLKKLSTVQKVLVLGITAMGTMLLYGLFTSPKGSPTQPHETTYGQNSSIAQLTQQDHAQVAPQIQTGFIPAGPLTKSTKSQTPSSLLEPLSLKYADTLTIQKNFNKAAATYEHILQNLPISEENEPLKDFLLFKIALCRKNAGETEQANYMFKSLAQSPSIPVRTLAKYQLSIAFLQAKRYLEAANRAYQTLAVIEAVDYSKNWIRSVQQNCSFLLAEATTKNVLSLCDADNELPPQLWPQTPDIDPFVAIPEEQLITLLQSGADIFNKALLGPHVQKSEDSSTTPRWLVICNAAPIDELLARVAANTGLEIRWAQNTALQSENDQDTIRKRPVTMYLPDATAHQICIVAAGSVGLFAKMDDNKKITIIDPVNYSALSEHIGLLAQDSISFWQRFLLTFEDDHRIPNVHFALGLLQTQTKQTNEALARYKLVANRYGNTPLAPYALLNSGKIKVALKDYLGAQEDLKQLVDLHPDVQFSDQACLYLADATMKAGLFAEAVKIYRRFYNLGLSTESQAAAAFGAGKCCYEQKDFDSAAQWFTRYLTLAPDHNRKDFHEASFLLGKTSLALGKPQQARAALQLALKGRLTKQQYTQTICTLIEAHVKEGNVVDALELLESTHSLQLSQQEQIDLLLLKANILRSLGLVSRAVAILDKDAQYLPDSQLRAKVFLEIAKCYIQEQDLERAYKTLSETFTIVEPGPLAHQVGCSLAEVCLQLGQDSQAAAVCSQLINNNPQGQFRDEVMNLSARIHNRQKNYDGAIMALLDSSINDNKADTGQNRAKSAVEAQTTIEKSTQ